MPVDRNRLAEQRLGGIEISAAHFCHGQIGQGDRPQPLTRRDLGAQVGGTSLCGNGAGVIAFGAQDFAQIDQSGYHVAMARAQKLLLDGERFARQFIGGILVRTHMQRFQATAIMLRAVSRLLSPRTRWRISIAFRTWASD